MSAYILQAPGYLLRSTEGGGWGSGTLNVTLPANLNIALLAENKLRNKIINGKYNYKNYLKNLEGIKTN